MADDNTDASWGAKSRGAIRKVTRPVGAAGDALTGRGVERNVAEYTETFTQVVLGLHEDLASVLRRLYALEQAGLETSTLKDQVASVSERTTALEAKVDILLASRQALRPRVLYFLVGFTFALATSALGLAIWALL